MLDPDQAEGLRNAALRASERRRHEFLLALLSGAGGREWMWHQLTTCDIFGSVFSPDAAVTAFNLGRQDWGKRMFAEILQIDPQSYFKMALEAKEREDALRRELDRAARDQDNRTYDSDGNEVGVGENGSAEGA